MFSPEKLYYQKLGIRKEYAGANIAAVTLFWCLSNLYAKRSGLLVQGSIPAEGEGFFLSNHPDDFDVLRVFYTAANYVRTNEGEVAPGRLVRFLAKSTLFGIEEPKSVRARTRKKDIWNSDNFITRAVVRMIVGSALYGIGAIPVRRGMPDRRAEREVSQTLANGQLAASTLIESRDASGGLKGIKTGPAFIIMQNPDTLFRLAGISRHPHIVNIGEPQTYRQLLREMGNMSVRELTMYLADGIMDLQPPHIQEEWRLGGREAAIQELYPRGKERLLTTTS